MIKLRQRPKKIEVKTAKKFPLKIPKKIFVRKGNGKEEEIEL